MVADSQTNTTGWRTVLRRTALCWMLVGCVLLSGAGCSQDRYLKLRKAPRNPLEGPLNLLSRKGPQPTDRTLQTLRRYDLVKLQEDEPAEALAQLQEEIRREPTVDKLHAFAELAYIAGYKADAVGENERALNLYGMAVFHAYDCLFDPLYDSMRNPYDPQFRRACDIYNSGLEAALRLINRNGQLNPGEVVVIDTGTDQVEVDVIVRGPWRPDEFDKFEFVSDYQLTGLKNHHHGYGLGVPMIAIRRSSADPDPQEQYYPTKLSFPVTAFLRINPGTKQDNGKVARRCVLELHDPLDSNVTQVANRLVPLETDLSTPLGYKLQNGQGNDALTLATLGLLKPDATESLQGLYMIEPFDPNKIPVLMVHGLWSSPMTWMEMFNDLLAYPEIRSNYQFWFYLYPTGEPFWVSATQLRNDLADVRSTLDPRGENPVFDQTVLVGHSMGGLLSMMQTLNSGDEFWRLVSERPFDELQAEPDVRESIAQTVFFEPNRSVHCVITIGTPHRGSPFANEYTRYLARKLIHLPSRMLWATQRLMLDNPDFFRDTDLLTISTSIDSLDPDSPIIPAMQSAERAPWVSYHNIVGIVPEDSFLSRFSERGDGVVAFDSAHREDFQSEVVVPSDHTRIHAHPRSILEVRRVLLEHLANVAKVRSGTGSVVVPASSEFPTSSATPNALPDPVPQPSVPQPSVPRTAQ